MPYVAALRYGSSGLTGEIRFERRSLSGAYLENQVRLAELSVQQHAVVLNEAELVEFLSAFLAVALRGADYVLLNEDIPSHLVGPICVFLAQIGIKTMSLEKEASNTCFYRCGTEVITLRSK